MVLPELREVEQTSFCVAPGFCAHRGSFHKVVLDSVGKRRKFGTRDASEKNVFEERGLVGALLKMDETIGLISSAVVFLSFEVP